MAITSFIEPNLLQSNCETVEQKEYMHRLTDDEKEIIHKKIVKQVLKLRTVKEEEAERKKEASKVIKALEKDLHEDTDAVNYGSRQVEGKLYKFLYREERTAAYYDENGNLVESRPMRPEEFQMSITPPHKTGTND